MSKTIKKPLLPMAHVVKAVDLLRKTNITLIGYIRGGKMNIYS
jgi:formate dehydrogenase assembly factor FdhD